MAVKGFVVSQFRFDTGAHPGQPSDVIQGDIMGADCSDRRQNLKDSFEFPPNASQYYPGHAPRSARAPDLPFPQAARALFYPVASTRADCPTFIHFESAAARRIQSGFKSAAVTNPRSPKSISAGVLCEFLGTRCFGFKWFKWNDASRKDYNPSRIPWRHRRAGTDRGTTLKVDAKISLVWFNSRRPWENDDQGSRMSCSSAFTGNAAVSVAGAGASSQLAGIDIIARSNRPDLICSHLIPHGKLHQDVKEKSDISRQAVDASVNGMRESGDDVIDLTLNSDDEPWHRGLNWRGDPGPRFPV
ncbi:hypothetical protein FB451DRAFT_1173143 [Mycena latifolia]|nr:hypothetical protein FB451DRAFT_1173143 [Mycena latifolia]